MPELHAIDPDEGLWERVQVCLDARGDPFADPVLARDLAARPATAARAAALRAGLRRLERPCRGRRARYAAAALLAVALVAGPWSVRTPPRAPTRVPTIALDVVRGTPPPPRGALRRLEPRAVLAWTYTGENP